MTIDRLAKQLVDSNLRRITQYDSARQVTRLSRRTYHGQIVKRAGVTIILTIGKPNARERDHIARMRKVFGAGNEYPHVVAQGMPKAKKKK